MSFQSLRRHQQPWALVLLLAVLLFTGWGQVHRVLHSGAPVAVATEAGKHMPGLADEDGSGLCKLLDQLAHGAGPVLTGLALAQGMPTAAPVGMPEVRRFTGTAHGFEARGPPRLA